MAASEDPLLAQLLINCARRAIQAEANDETQHRRTAGFEGHQLELRDEAPPPLGETFPTLTQPAQRQPWPRRDDAPHHPR
jgi:hypothetical protein